METAPATFGNSRYSQTNNTLSLFDNFGLLGAFRRRIFSSWRRTAFSARSCWGERKQSSTNFHRSLTRSAMRPDDHPILFSATKSSDRVFGRDRGNLRRRSGQTSSQSTKNYLVECTVRWTTNFSTAFQSQWIPLPGALEA
jgi:hypothetical protein